MPIEISLSAGHHSMGDKTTQPIEPRYRTLAVLLLGISPLRRCALPAHRIATHSAAGFPTLFAGFIATMARTDFSSPCIIGFGSSPSRCGPSSHVGPDGQT
jgi:hypothetical protein